MKTDLGTGQSPKTLGFWACTSHLADMPRESSRRLVLCAAQLNEKSVQITAIPKRCRTRSPGMEVLQRQRCSLRFGAAISDRKHRHVQR